MSFLFNIIVHVENKEFERICMYSSGFKIFDSEKSEYLNLYISEPYPTQFYFPKSHKENICRCLLNYKSMTIIASYIGEMLLITGFSFIGGDIENISPIEET